jgi:hypothetical protein
MHFLLLRRTYPTASVVEAYNDDLLRLDDERNGDPPLEADNAKAGANVVAPMATFGCILESPAVDLDTVQIGCSDRGSATLGDPVMQFEEVCLGA